MIGPGAWLGLLGGGQLGRMFTMAAQSMGYKVLVLDPGSNSPAGTVADGHLQADYTDAKALAEIASRCGTDCREYRILTDAIVAHVTGEGQAKTW